jgi:hypothetical protein
MSILILDNDDGTCTVDITGSRSVSGTLAKVYDLGEASFIADKIFKEIDEADILKKYTSTDKEHQPEADL